MKFQSPQDDKVGATLEEGNQTNIRWWEKTLQNPPPRFVEMFEAQRKFLIEHIPAGAKVLDIGCGDGRNMRTVLSVTPNVVGVDIDLKAVQDAKENLKDFPSVEVLQANASRLPFADKSFDRVVLFDILINLEDGKISVLKEIKRILKEDGKLLLSSYSEDAYDARLEMYKQVGVPIQKDENGTFVFGTSEEDKIMSEQFSKEEIEEMAAEAGMKVVDCEHVKGIAYICELE